MQKPSGNNNSPPNVASPVKPFTNPPGSKLTKQTLEACLDQIRKQYLADSRPWVIGYSGGKDSTCVLQLAWNALIGLPAAKFTKPVYIITSDTLVETPAVETHLSKTTHQIADAARAQNLPFEAHQVSPLTDETFWVNLIGRGYPAPYTRFRWCTEKMKIRPVTKFINDKVAEHGEVVLLLGSRRAESSTRAQVLDNRDKVGTFLARHKDLPNAYVFTPIEDWSTQDVWTYLTSSRPPWGGDNSELVTMYRNAQAGECPLVIDKSTPSCGGGRFGCWTCTVVEKDRSMEAMIDNGEEWMQPLLDFREWLVQTEEPERRKQIREMRRRSGRIEFFKYADGKEDFKYGPFKLSFRKEILERLLTAQQQVRKNGPDQHVQLIRENELHRIRQLWRLDEGDWQDSLPAIHQKVTGETLDWLEDDWSGMGGAEQEVLKEVSADCRLPTGLLVELMDVERKYHGMSRRSGVYTHLEKTLNKDWRTPDQARAEYAQPPLQEQEDPSEADGAN
jgi:DNA sulfur modification protein DndC